MNAFTRAVIQTVTGLKPEELSAEQRADFADRLVIMLNGAIVVFPKRNAKC